MRITVRSKAFSLLSILLIHTALASPIVKRDVLSIGNDESFVGADQGQLSLYDADVFGGEAHENGSREKRFFKLKALGIGAGIKAAGVAAKTVGALGVKAVGKTALKAATTVGVKVAKAAITIGIAKLLLSLVFGKINQLIDFKTRLLGSSGGSGGGGGGILSSSTSLSSGSAGSSSGGGGGASVAAHADVDGVGVSAEAGTSVGAGASVGTDSEVGDLPEIDPNKVSLQVPNEFISGGFNVVNRAAPVVGEVVQNTAQRLLRLAGGLKPILGSSLGFRSSKRETQQNDEDELSDEFDKQESRNHEYIADPNPVRRRFILVLPHD